MSAIVHHRGPDGSGVFHDPERQVSLAMQRLSIIDLATGTQPMANEDRSLWIVHNGEIYNAPELRPALEARGHRFATNNSDTEVLLHLYEDLGPRMMRELNGMFAFTIYDRSARRFFGARDRLGIKPLYYMQLGMQWIFASELKCFLALPWFEREIDRASLFHYVSLGFVPGEDAILRGVHRLPPGCTYTYDLDSGMARIEPYWDLDWRPDQQPSEAEWAEVIRTELRAAVHRWTLSDVPIACSLSGGIDSSTIVGLLAESGYGPIKTFSLGFTGEGEEEWNELDQARLVAERWGTDHHELVLHPDALLQDLIPMVWYLDEPYGGGLPSWYVFRLMSEEVKVGLTGTGGDELFGDYSRFLRLERSEFVGRALRANGSGQTPRWADRLWRPAAAVVRALPKTWLSDRRREELVHLPGVLRDPFRWLYFNTYYYLSDEAKREFVFAWLLEEIPDTAGVLTEILGRKADGDLRNRIAYVDCKTQLAEEFLLMTDRFSMAHSLEARVPFLDHRFVERVMQIPSSVRIRPGDPKYLLKRAVADLLPPEVLSGRKRGFILPTARWLRGPLRPLVERLLAKSRLSRQGIFRPEIYDRYVVPHVLGHRDYHQQIWHVLMFQLWHLLFIEERAIAQPAYSWHDII